MSINNFSQLYDYSRTVIITPSIEREWRSHSKRVTTKMTFSVTSADNVIENVDNVTENVTETADKSGIR